jgi:hypothetical protein
MRKPSPRAWAMHGEAGQAAARRKNAVKQQENRAETAGSRKTQYADCAVAKCAAARRPPKSHKDDHDGAPLAARQMGRERQPPKARRHAARNGSEDYAWQKGRAISEQRGGRTRRPFVREQQHSRGREAREGGEQGGEGELGQQGRNPLPGMIQGHDGGIGGGQCHHWGAGSPC